MSAGRFYRRNFHMIWPIHLRYAMAPPRKGSPNTPNLGPSGLALKVIDINIFTSDLILTKIYIPWQDHSMVWWQVKRLIFSPFVIIYFWLHYKQLIVSSVLDQFHSVKHLSLLTNRARQYGMDNAPRPIWSFSQSILNKTITLWVWRFRQFRIANLINSRSGILTLSKKCT